MFRFRYQLSTPFVSLNDKYLELFTEKLYSKPFERIGLHSNDYTEQRDGTFGPNEEDSEIT